MNAEIQTAHDDLAFMRALVDAGENAQAPFGEGYLAAGLVYGAQMLAQAAQAAGWLSMRPLAGIALGLGPTVVFLIVLVWILRRHRHARAVGLVARTTSSLARSRRSSSWSGSSVSRSDRRSSTSRVRVAVTFASGMIADARIMMIVATTSSSMNV